MTPKRLDDLDADLSSIRAERDALRKERDDLLRERQALAQERNALALERDTLSRERNALAKEREAGEIYRFAVQNAPVGIMCCSVRTGEYIFSNAAHAGFLGYTPEEIVGGDPHQRWMQITHPEDFQRELDEHQRLAQGEITSFESERRCIRKDGEVHWARVTVVGSRDDKNRLEYIYVYFVDVHDHHTSIEARERLEAELRQSQKIEALGRLAGGVAHDFNNRLLVIMGYAEGLKHRFPPASVEAGQAEMVIASAQRAAELTRQLLAYSRRQVMKPRSFDLNETIDRMRRWLERLIGENIELVTELAAKQPVFCDPGQIEQVVLNLAVNARDAMTRGGRLTLETYDTTVHETDQLRAGDYVVLVARDTGSGIPNSVLPRIFEPFFTTKEVGSGTGLGLAMVDGIVRQSGGAVSVESAPETGTTFSVYLPRATVSADRASEISPEPPSRDLTFETLLVCDDDDGVRRLLVDLLRVRSYHVLEACNGKHAIQIARSHSGPIDVLITDLVMPEIGGVELASTLRRHRTNLKVLYVSGYTDNEAVLSGALGPGENFLGKPFLPGELVRAVLGLLSGGGEGAEVAKP
jgi:two-component system, cell cycle sensor histidine kinase and response regulator CckA